MPAKLKTLPLRGASGKVRREHDTEGALLIPGRPQSKLERRSGEPLAAGYAYLAIVKRIARETFGELPHIPRGHVELKIRLCYTFPSSDADYVRANPGLWHMYSIPRADNAAGIILQGLAGHLYTHAGQVQPLTVLREVMGIAECMEQYGEACQEGAAVIAYE